MSEALLEIVDLGDGEIVLQRADDESEPLVTIRFSEPAQHYTMDSCLEIAKVMFQAGLEAAALLAEEEETQASSAEFYSEAPRTLH
ncbi:hypothetical protein E4634_11195 [Mangrovimicrobium sediminis]|uniref:Uncharacterized protein n=1 Tax=Mangrovimicrobium sediminis TaxID=2562682 RepID=A0A4Z0M1L6_9GAMM|nr:hypothetical protein [Haliea sp. SAOS-164]TGD73583.1 hypothetical protein E4634_11195 [Haliea sp. SAOS-164]